MTEYEHMEMNPIFPGEELDACLFFVVFFVVFFLLLSISPHPLPSAPPPPPLSAPLPSLTRPLPPSLSPSFSLIQLPVCDLK